MRAFWSHVQLGDHVNADGHKDLVMVVTALTWRDDEGPTIELSWIYDGQSCSAWFHPRRVTLADGRRP